VLILKITFLKIKNIILMYFIVKNILKNNRYYIPKYPLNKYSRKQYHGLSVKIKTKMMGCLRM